MLLQRHSVCLFGSFCWHFHKGGKPVKSSRSSVRLLITFLLFWSFSLWGASVEECQKRKNAPAGFLRDLKFVGEYCKVDANAEHSMGYCVRLFQRKGKCEGYLLHYNGPLEPRLALLRKTHCTDNSVTFETSDGYETGFRYQGPKTLVTTFSGKMSKQGLEGALIDADSGRSTAITWKKQTANMDSVASYANDLASLMSIQSCLDTSMTNASGLDKEILAIPINVNNSVSNDKSIELLCPKSGVADSGIYRIMASKNKDVRGRLHYLIQNASQAIGKPSLGKCLADWLVHPKTTALTDETFAVFLGQLDFGSYYGYPDELITDFASSLKSLPSTKQCWSAAAGSTPVCTRIQKTIDRMIAHAKEYLKRTPSPDYLAKRNQANLQTLEALRLKNSP